MGRILNRVANFLYYLMIFLSFLFHLWTIYIAYKLSGFIGAILTFFLPVLSHIFLSFISWRVSGFESPYIQWAIVIVVMWIISFVYGIFAAYISSLLDKKDSYKRH